MRIGSDHKGTRERIVFEDNLVDNTTSWLPEAHAKFAGRGSEKIVDLKAT